MHARHRRFAALLAGAALLAACGGDDPSATEPSEADGATASDDADETSSSDGTSSSDDASDTAASEGTEPSPSDDTAGAAEAAGEVLALTAVDYGYDGLAPEVAAGTRVELSNASDAELHELVAIRLPDDEQRSGQELVALPPEELAGLFPHVTDVVLVPPAAGADEAIPAVGDGVLEEPGRYLFLCAIPTGADPVAYLTAAAQSEDGPPEVPGGPPHLAQGMWAEVAVVAG